MIRLQAQKNEITHRGPETNYKTTASATSPQTNGIRDYDITYMILTHTHTCTC